MSDPKITLLDGGTGRELKRMGAPFRQPEWSALALIEAPEFVTRVHAAYVQSGADLITTNTYAVVPFHIGERFASEGAVLAGLAGRLARQAADQGTGVRVAGSLPPVCGSYRPDLFDAGRARPVLATLRGALAPYVDLWLAETLSSIAEAQLVRAILGEDTRPLWISYTLAEEDAQPGSPRLRSGEPVSEAARVAATLGAEALLFNCSQPEVMGPAVTAARTALGNDAVRIGVYANAFPPQSTRATANETLHTTRADLDPSAYLDWAQRWVALGARIVGGCCGIGPEHIAALRMAFPR